MEFTRRGHAAWDSRHGVKAGCCGLKCFGVQAAPVGERQGSRGLHPSKDDEAQLSLDVAKTHTSYCNKDFDR